LYNIPVIQSLRVLEGAASIALLIAPEKAKGYLDEIGVEPVEDGGEGNVSDKETIFNIRELTRLQERVEYAKRSSHEQGSH